jgi:hypothetical protein
MMARRKSEHLERLIRRAAYMRATGERWSAIAVVVKRSPNTVRKWPIVHAQLWESPFAEARQESDRLWDEWLVEWWRIRNEGRRRRLLTTASRAAHFGTDVSKTKSFKAGTAFHGQ